ncbi:hypothetical protein DFH11DRAFT_461816 [Phellopilus nigrolimitatus]|nr:hypothetical protein DFH11DRAFT_461816 [Phellopilus nigrolimitatus]
MASDNCLLTVPPATHPAPFHFVSTVPYGAICSTCGTFGCEISAGCSATRQIGGRYRGMDGPESDRESCLHVLVSDLVAICLSYFLFSLLLFSYLAPSSTLPST